ncbi:MAG: hypothetical protein M1445_16890 [Bacteroidetes bacterium]|nr:hypothetical protein [Bacteroidota bacterium]MCL6101424.1 hypothetical protein [Bacteroidota bacterium]
MRVLRKGSFQLGKLNRKFFLIFLAGVLCVSSYAQTDQEQVISKQDNRSWLPVTTETSSIAPDVVAFLRSLNGSMRLLYCRYDGSKLVKSQSFKDYSLNLSGNRWHSSIKVRPVNEDKTAMDLDVQFRLDKGAERSAGVAVAFDFKNWSIENYVMLPASVYNGNRCKLVDRGYAKGLDRKYLYEKNIPLMSVPIPQLSPKQEEISRLEVNACNLATPAMCFFDKKLKRAFILLAEQGVRIGDNIFDNGFIVEESQDRSRATLVVSAPGVREQKPEFIGFSKSPDRGIDWKTGDELTLRLRLYSFETPNIPGLLEKFMSVRKAVTGINHPRNLFPFSKIIRLMTNNIDSRFYDGKDFKFYCPENADWISFGWIGGLMNTFPMLVLGDSLHLDRVTSTFNFAIPRGQGKSGYFFGALNYDGKCFSREGYREFPEIVLTRKNADVLFWMVKQFMLLKAQGKTDRINSVWETNIRRLADAFVATWTQNGQWGRMLNNQNGEVAEYNTSGGVMAIGGLALASTYYGNSQYLKIAKRAAHFYYQHDFVERGMTTGGCGDILQNADSETAAGFMTSLMALYELTGEKKWLEMSRNLANLCATWIVSYDYELPSNTELAQLGAKLAGVVWASTQNKHGAPGFCTSSGDPLFKIYRATGDIRYAELMYDVVHAYAEGIQPNGRITERLTYCDADSRGSRGTGGKTGWTELNGILMAMELPGIYLKTDENRLFVFDHVEAKVLKRGNDGVVILITNPTKYDATVSIFAETSINSKKPLGYTAFLKWPKVEVSAGASIQVHISSNGNILK